MVVVAPCSLVLQASYGSCGAMFSGSASVVDGSCGAMFSGSAGVVR